MEKTRPILYGVADYAEIRKAHAWFVDRTAKIRDLEATRYAMFLRPRRFGKSLIVSMLQYYYDVAFTDRFDELFGGTDIGASPTDERGTYLALYFDFSGVSKEIRKVQGDFDSYASLCCDTFARKYANRLPDGLAGRILAASGCTEKLNEIFLGMRSASDRLYVLIDEYDNFTNTILAESGLNAYNDLCHGDGFFKQFFTILKTATGGVNAPVTRLFVTGVSPVTMDDVTSGFNIGTNISLDPRFADFTGFRHDDLRAIADYYGAHCGFDADKAYEAALTWYDNYRFGSANAQPLANTTIVLGFFSFLWRTHQFPDNMIDANLRTDYAKIRHLILNGGCSRSVISCLATFVSGERVSAPLISDCPKITEPWALISWLYHVGLLSIVGSKYDNYVFEIPNGCAKRVLTDLYSSMESYGKS